MSNYQLYMFIFYVFFLIREMEKLKPVQATYYLHDYNILCTILVTFMMTKITSTAATPIAQPPKSIFHRCHLVKDFSTGYGTRTLSRCITVSAFT